MNQKYYMKFNENLLWFSVIVLCLLSQSSTDKFSILTIFWVLIIIAVGNAKRIYSPNHANSILFIRRAMYVIPYCLPLIVYLPLLKTGNSVYWYLLGIIVGVILLLPKINEWRLFLSFDVIELSPYRTKSDYLSSILMILGAAIGEELFFRGFIYYVSDASNVLFFCISPFLFFLNHFGAKWNASFKSYDYIFQILFSILSCVLYVFSQSIVPCILAHIFYNFPTALLEIRSLVYHHYRAKATQ